MQKAITIYTKYGIGRLVADGIKVYTVKRELLEIWKTTIITSYGHEIPMYDMEHTMCDLVRSRGNFELQDFQTELKAYAKRKDKVLNKLRIYAKLFHVDKRIREYMKVLL